MENDLSAVLAFKVWIFNYAPNASYHVSNGKKTNKYKTTRTKDAGGAFSLPKVCSEQGILHRFLVRASVVFLILANRCLKLLGNFTHNAQDRCQ